MIFRSASSSRTRSGQKKEKKIANCFRSVCKYNCQEWSPIIQGMVSDQLIMQLNRKEKFNILTEGINKLDPQYFHTNLRISLAVQNFISKTKRFSL